MAISDCLARIDAVASLTVIGMSSWKERVHEGTEGTGTWKESLNATLDAYSPLLPGSLEFLLRTSIDLFARVLPGGVEWDEIATGLLLTLPTLLTLCLHAAE